MQDKKNLLLVEMLVRIYAIMEERDRKRVVEWVAKKYRCAIIFDVADGKRAGYFAPNQRDTIHLMPDAPIRTMFHELGHRFFYKMCRAISYLATAALLLTPSIIAMYYLHPPAAIALYFSLIFITALLLITGDLLFVLMRVSFFHFLGRESAANWWAKREMVRVLKQSLRKQKQIRSLMEEVDKKMGELDDECLPIFSRGKRVLPEAS
jgi:hypothetical protein